MNFYSFHPGDYTLRTAHLEPLEDLAYRRLLDLYYLNESPLEGSPEELARIIRMRTSAAEVKAILDEFFSPSEAGWRHGHCDEVIAKYHAKAQQAATNGKAGGRPKKPKDNPAETNPVSAGLPEESGSKTNQEPETNNHNQEDPKPSACASAPAAGKSDRLEGFAQFWLIYPRKTAKQNAEKAWAKLRPDRSLQAQLLVALGKQAKSPDWTKDGGSFIPHAATWLNGKRWEDELEGPLLDKHKGFNGERDYKQGLEGNADGTFKF